MALNLLLDEVLFDQDSFYLIVVSRYVDQLYTIPFDLEQIILTYFDALDVEIYQKNKS